MNQKKPNIAEIILYIFIVGLFMYQLINYFLVTDSISRLETFISEFQSGEHIEKHNANSQ